MLRDTATAIMFLVALPAAGEAASLRSTPCEDYAQAECVFVGTLDGLSETDNWWDEFARFTVEEHLKGDGGTTLLVRAPRMLVHGSVAGQRWLVFANRSKESLVMWNSVGQCGATFLTLRVPRELPVEARMLSFAISVYGAFVAMSSSDGETDKPATGTAPASPLR